MLSNIIFTLFGRQLIENDILLRVDTDDGFVVIFGVFPQHFYSQEVFSTFERFWNLLEDMDGFCSPVCLAASLADKFSRFVRLNFT